MTVSPMTTSRDVLIVGGGVAGYAASIALAEAGRVVTLLDRDLRGPDRLGESFDWETPLMLDQLGISIDTLVESDDATVKGGAVASHAMMSGRVRIGFHFLYRLLMSLVGRTKPTYHVHRGSLSRALHDRAVDVGVELIESRVVKVETDGDRIVAVESEEGGRYEADQYLDATGRARLLARALGVPVTKIGPAKLAVSTRLVHRYDHLGTRIRLDDSRRHPTWIWDINTGEHRTDVGAVFVAADVATARRGGETICDLYRSELARHDDLGWALEQIPDARDLDRCAFQDQVSDRLVGTNWVIAGQAAAVIDPLLSSGVSFGFRSGLSSARVIAARCGDHVGSEVLADRYDRLLRSYALTVNTLLDQLWYQTRLRFVHGFAINVLLLLVCNFNLNHLQSRWFVQTRIGAPATMALHRLVRRVVPGTFRALEAVPTLARRASKSINTINPALPQKGIT